MHKTIQFYTKILTLFSILFAPVIYFLIWKRKEKLFDGKSRIFVIPQLTRIGDLVCSTSVFGAIKKAYPESHLVVLTSVMASGIIKNNPHIDEIITVEEYMGHFLGLIKKIRNGKFDIGISLSGTSLSSLLFFYGLIPKRIKLIRHPRPFSEMATDWMSNRKERYTHGEYIPEFYKKLLQFINISGIDMVKKVYTDKRADIRSRGFLDKHNIHDDDVVIGVNPFAGNNKEKEWGIENYAKLCDELCKDRRIIFVVMGMRNDKISVDELMSLTKGRLVPALDFSLEELPSLIKHFDLFISGDTGLMHIADALGIPLIDIIGPVYDGELTPRGDNVKIVKPNPPVDPTIFAFRKQGDLELSKKAIKNTSVESVVKAAHVLMP